MLAHLVFGLAAVGVLWPSVSSGLALFLGVLLAVTIGNPFLTRTRAWTSPMLGLAVVGLGAGMNLATVARVGLEGLGYTVASITAALLCGWTVGRVLKIDRNVSWLITVGTAICGGSAIAAVAPALRAKPHEVTISLAIVFMLNAVALFAFPPIGHALGLSEDQFGLWSALAIHDTSSVVGAAMQYGAHALEVGTTIKLARALWIVPLTLVIDALVARPATADADATETGSSRPPAKRPWFILGFVATAALVTWIPELARAGHVVEFGAKRFLVLTLFLIGSSLSRQTLTTVGPRPFLQGVILWLVMAAGTLLLI